MKILLICLLLTTTVFAQDKKIYYEVEKGDTFGSVLFSMGYITLWSGSAYVNKFKHKITPSPVDKVKVGDKVYFDESEIVFKKNVEIKDDRIFFKRKIHKLDEWKELAAIEETKDAPEAPQELVVESDKAVQVYSNATSSFEIYAGAGGFVARDVEADRSTSTTTMTGIQPMAQVKGIYSHSSIGSLAVDVLAKKIFNSEFSFPVNTDFRFQYIPKWINLGDINLAVSYSMLKHSYVGKPEEEEKEYELSANFVGVGFVWPKETYWFEVYLEKALASETESDDQTIKLNEGWRVDSELIYPLTRTLRLIPGINYYTTKNSSKEYQMTVLELRSTIAWEF